MPDLGGLRLNAELVRPEKEALRPLRETSAQLGLLALVFLAVALPAVVLFARSTTRGLRRLTAAAGDVRAERVPDFHGVTDAAPREVRVLSEALETMVGRLEASRQELARQESLAAMGMMAAGLAHEIRTPLSIMRGSAEMLTRGVDPGSREEELLSFILDETGRLSRLVNDLLSFARPRDPELKPVDLAAIAREAVQAMRREYEADDLVLESDLAPSPILGDPDQLRQLMLNLLANARKASAADGSVTVSTSVRDGAAVLEVRDRGRGIPAHELDEIWDPFFTRGRGGTGLGLPIVRRITEGHSGEVTLESEQGVGTVVTVRIPIRSEE
jgi:signal transduction histidine kinase